MSYQERPAEENELWKAVAMRNFIFEQFSVTLSRVSRSVQTQRRLYTHGGADEQRRRRNEAHICARYHAIDSYRCPKTTG